MANTFIELNDTPSNFIGHGLKYVRVNGSEDQLLFVDPILDDLKDVQANGAYLPQGGQALVYSSAAGKWRPSTMDVYSAGNGLNKNALTLNVTAGAGGGLTSNSSGVYITEIDNVAGTIGNASHVPIITINSKGQVTGATTTPIVAEFATTITNPFVGNINGTSGQIRVTGGTGNNSNAVIDLVATGVTSATYGNTTHLPRITVDTYGRIQNVDLIEIAGVEGGTGGGTSLAFGNILVAGQTTVSADQASDDVTFVAGAGMSITTQANADRIIFGIDSGAVASSINLADLNDIDATDIVNGQVLIWNSSTSKFEAGNMSGGSGDSNVDLTDFSVNTAAPSGNGSLVYNNAGVFTFTPANVQASGGSTQSLSWNSSTYALSISSGNSVDLSVLKDNTDAQTLSLAGNVITISGSNSNVNLTSLLSSAAGNYGDSNVATYLSTNSYATETYVNTANTNMKAYVDAGLSNVAGNYSDSNVAAYLADNDYATESYVNTQISVITSGASAALDTLAEIANALNNSNATLATVAFTGNYANLSNKPILELSSSNLSLDGTIIDLSGVIGQQGIQGNVGLQGNTGVSVSSATVTGANLIITLSDASTIDAGNVQGPQGIQGLAGDGNAGIANATVESNNNLIIGLVNGTYINAGNVKGPQGEQGDAGVGITSVSLVSSNLVLNYSNTSTQDVGNIQGPQGAAGVDVTSATVNGSGNLIITLSDASTVDAGNVRGTDGTDGVDGVDGADGIQLSNISVTTDPASGNGSLAYNNTTGVFTFTPANISAGGLGDLVGPSSATDNAVTRFDSTTGKLVQNSLVTISDTGAITAPNNTGSMIPFYYENAQAFPAAANSHGALAHNHADGKMYYAHAGVWIELANSADIVAGGSSSSTFANLTEINTADLDVHDIGRQAATTLVVTAPSASAYRFDQYDTTNNPTIYTKAGTTIGFDLSALGSHPFRIQTTGASAYSTGLIHIAPNGTVSTGASAQGKTSGTLYWKVPASISGTYEYQCTSHGVMNGNIEIEAAAGAGAGSGIALSDLSGGTGISYSNVSGVISLANTAVTAGTYGSSTKSARLTVDAQGRITSVTEATISGGEGGSGATIERFKLNYNSAGALISTANVSAGIGSITIDSSSGGECTITFANGTYFLPPGSIMFYGYDYTNNKYQIVPMETSMGFREVPAGGTSGSPTLFNGASQVVVKLRLREAETGASRGGFGTTTHAWIQFVMYD